MKSGYWLALICYASGLGLCTYWAIGLWPSLALFMLFGLGAKFESAAGRKP